MGMFLGGYCERYNKPQNACCPAAEGGPFILARQGMSLILGESLDLVSLLNNLGSRAYTRGYSG